MNPVIDVFGVNIAEPMTMLTDYLIFAASSWFAVTLFNAAEHRGQSCRKLWASAFLIIGIGALLGGTSHGFAPHLDDTAMYWIWKGTLACVGASMYFSVAGTIRGADLPGKWRSGLAVANVAGLIAYVVWIANYDTFLAVIIDSTLALLVVALLQGRAWRRSGATSAPWLIAGVIVSFLGAAVQQSGLSLHLHFNHNDLYHTVQLFALYLFYRGACLLSDQRDDAATF
jgi:hypothetical protein